MAYTGLIDKLTAQKTALKQEKKEKFKAVNSEIRVVVKKISQY